MTEGPGSRTGRSGRTGAAVRSKTSTGLLPLAIAVGLFAVGSPARFPASAPVTRLGEVVAPPFTKTAKPVGRATFAYYVSPAGDDSNPGTREEPWATPGYGSRQIASGDTLVILAGSYSLSLYDDDIIMPPSGTPLAWTVVRGEGGERPVLAGSQNLFAAIEISGKHHVRIENLEITSDGGEPFRTGIAGSGAPTHHLVFENLRIHHIDEGGIDMGDVEHLTIDRCRVTYCGFGAIGGPAGVAGGWRNVRIVDSELSWSGHYYQGGPGPGPYDRPDGFGIEPSSGPIEIERTLAAHNRGDGLDSKAENTFVHECVVANNSCDGVKLWGTGSRLENVLIYGRGDGSMIPTPWAAVVIGTEDTDASFEMINVTVDDSLGGNHLMYVQYDSPDVPVTLTVVNSIFCARGLSSSIFLGRAVNFLMGYNLFYLPRSGAVLEHGEESYGPSEVGDLGPGNTYGDPLFLMPAFGTQGDYHLEEGSPAIDSGTRVLAPPADLEGTPRPQGGGFDRGSYEQ